MNNHLFERSRDAFNEELDTSRIFLDERPCLEDELLDTPRDLFSERPPLGDKLLETQRDLFGEWLCLLLSRAFLILSARPPSLSTAPRSHFLIA